ncbi:MAG: bifunctional 4-hydroxy-2-oxoglutarate aldolase/2-dehydro-3-deoxy-phosphogluconate aldolase [Oleispira sp.]|nr:bifunctional 4-hydroxy-2-oxoglutarate aldolase/2-dehydro-3-deoxy-phosphogluconate aldolase [Oleispira sp.]
MTKLNTWLKNTKPLIPVIVIENPDHAVPMAKALVAGGIHLLEVTLRTAAGLAAIKQISEQVPEAIVGAGTICNADDYQQAIDAGAQFIVSPGLTAELIAKAKQVAEEGKWSGVFLPGVATASEVMQAKDAGFTQLKCFPASAIGGVKLLKAWAGPFSDIQFCPTGGISLENYQEYLALPNVICAGGSWLTEARLLKSGDWEEVERRAMTINNSTEN